MYNNYNYNPQGQQNHPQMNQSNLQSLAQNLKVQQNPLSYLNAIAGHDPVVARAAQMMQGKSPEQIWELANNLAKEHGTTVDQVIGSLGV